jgi:cardiolipin synthase
MQHDTFYDAVLTAISTAAHRLAIVTPYYVPDDSIQRALVLAARRGVRTELVVPERSNHPLADFARRGLVRELSVSGVQIRLYPKGMVHAKAMVVDDTFAYIGSPNMDCRSFFLNYENALCVYDATHVGVVRGWIERLIAECRAGSESSGREHWVLEQLARLLAPEL